MRQQHACKGREQPLPACLYPRTSMSAGNCRGLSCVRGSGTGIEFPRGRGVKREELQIRATAQIRGKKKLLRLIERQRKRLRAHRGERRAGKPRERAGREHSVAADRTGRGICSVEIVAGAIERDGARLTTRGEWRSGDLLEAAAGANRKHTKPGIRLADEEG